MSLLVRSVCAVLLALALVSPSPVARAQLGGLGGSIDLNLPVEPPSLPSVPESPVISDPGGLPGSPGIQVPGGVIVDHAAALKAVQDKRALPLNELLKGVAKAYRGQVIDVQLVLTKGQLLYEVKMLDARGSVTVVDFNAATGKPLPPR
jgi:hypothetical protein